MIVEVFMRVGVGEHLVCLVDSLSQLGRSLFIVAAFVVFCAPCLVDHIVLGDWGFARFLDNRRCCCQSVRVYCLFGLRFCLSLEFPCCTMHHDF